VLKNYIVVSKHKKVAMAKLAQLCKAKDIVWQRSDRSTAEIAMKNGDMYYWVVPSRNRRFNEITFERAYIECKTDIKSSFYNHILTPITRHEEFFDGSYLDGTAFVVTDADVEAIWNESWRG